jgi:phosphoribosylglycinamide formyltransferase 1
MKKLRLGILGSGKGSNCRAILEQISAGKLPAEVRLVVSDVFDAGILDIAREFRVPNIYLPPGNFRTRLEPNVEMELVRLLRGAGGARRFYARAERADARSVSAAYH